MGKRRRCRKSRHSCDPIMRNPDGKLAAHQNDDGPGRLVRVVKNLRYPIALAVFWVSKEQVCCDHLDEGKTALLGQECCQRRLPCLSVSMEENTHERRFIRGRNLQENPDAVKGGEVRLGDASPPPLPNLSHVQDERTWVMKSLPLSSNCLYRGP